MSLSIHGYNAMTLHVQLYNYHALRKLTVPRYHVASRIRFSRRRRSRFNMHKLITGRRPGASNCPHERTGAIATRRAWSRRQQCPPE